MISKLKFIVLILILISIGNCYANTLCQIKGGGILDNLVNQVNLTGQAWQTTINPLAKKIFFILFGAEFMWQLTVKKVFSGDIEKLWVFFFSRTVLCFFFAKYLVNIELYRGIIVYISNLGSRLGGFSLNIGNNNFQTIGPSAVLGSFSCMADAIHQMTDATGSFNFITLKITLAIIQVILFINLSFIAYSIMRVLIQTYFLIYVGFLLSGFVGSSWTSSYWNRYLKTVGGVSIKFLALCFIMGILMSEIQAWAIEISKAGNLVDLATTVMHVLASSFILAFLTYELPQWAATNLSGEINHLVQNHTPMPSFTSSQNPVPPALLRTPNRGGL